MPRKRGKGKRGRAAAKQRKLVANPDIEGHVFGASESCLAVPRAAWWLLARWARSTACSRKDISHIFVPPALRPSAPLRSPLH